MLKLKILNKNNKKIGVFLGAIIVSAAIFLLVPKPAHAGLFGSLMEIGFGAMTSIIASLSEIVFFVLGLFLSLAAGLFDFALNPASQFQIFTKADIVKTGWALSRDVANMFFAIILLVVSFATILRLEEYGVKKILPKIIIAAILINFSLVIAGVVIDFTQVLTTYFFNQMKGNTSVSERMTAALNPGNLLAPPPGLNDFIKEMEGAKTAANQAPTGSNDAICAKGTAGLAGAVLSSAEQSQVAASCQLGKDGSYITNETANRLAAAEQDKRSASIKFLQVILNSIYGSIIMLVGIFVFFAGAILLIIRVVTLWFLLILAPLAWLFYILPATSGYFKQWWSKFFNQAFFAPALAFMLWIAISSLDKLPSFPMSKNGFSPAFVFNYVIIIGLFLGSLLVAKQMGASGAGAMISMGQRGRKWVTGQVGNQAGKVYDKAATKVTAVAARIAGNQKWDKTEARLKALNQRAQKTAAGRPGAKWKTEVMEQMSDGGVVDASAKGDINAARVALKRGLHTRRDAAGNAVMNASQVQQMEKTLRKYNDHENADKLVKGRLDSLATDPANLDKLDTAVASAVQEGNLGLISAIAIENDQVVAALAKYATPKQLEDLRGRSRQHETALVNTLGNLSTAMPNDKRIQFAYASHSGDVSKMDGTLKEEWASTAGADGLKRIKISNILDIPSIADNIPPNVLRKVIEEIKDPNTVKMIVKQVISNTDAKSHKAAVADPYINNQI